MEEISCSHCSRCIDLSQGGSDFCASSNCDCFFCPLCALRVVAVRFKTPTCKRCKSPIGEFQYYASDRKVFDEGEAIELTNREPELLMDPVRYHINTFENLPDDEKDSKFILSLSYPQRIDGEMTSTAVCAVLDKEIGPETAEDEHELRKIFTVLHVPLFNVNKNLFKNAQFDPWMTAGEYMEYAIYDDPSLLLKILFAFGTGNFHFDLDRFRTEHDYRSKFFGVAVAKEMLQRVNLAKPGPFQLMLANQLETWNVDSEGKNFFSSMKMAASISHMRKKGIELREEKFETDYTPDPLSMETRPFDNAGWKGRKKKWSQHCIIQRKTVTEKQLREDGFYDGEKISRKRRSFTDFASKTAKIDMRFVKDEAKNQVDALEALAAEVVMPTDEDKKILSNRILESINCAITLSLPNLRECAKLRKLKQIHWEEKIPLNLGTKIEEPTRAEPHTRPMSKEGKCAGIAGESATKTQLVFGQPTIYEANNITLEKPWHMDPNATKTVEKLMEYMEATSEWDPETVDLTETGGEPPLRDLFVVGTCDGSPMKRFLDIMSRDIRESDGNESNRKFKKVRFFMGGMHYLMEFANMSNRLSRDYLAYFVSSWRPTEPQLNWLLCVSDPTDYVLEMPQYILAHYRAAVDGLRKKDPKAELTPANVHDHMLERAAEYPVCMAILLNLRFVEIALMIRDSEKSGEHGDVDLFLSTMRLALPIFTASHAVNYVHICCDFLEWWELASDAEKLFFRKYLYTQKSPLGKPVWADRIVEWTMRHLRMFLGRYARPNQNKRVEKTVAEVPFRVASKRDIRALGWRENNLDMYSSVAFNMQSVKLSKVFVETYMKAMAGNLWGCGPLDGDFCVAEGNSILDEPPFEFPIDGKMEPMSTSFLSSYAIGEERLKEYYIKWHITDRHAANRDGLNHKLRLIPSQSATRRKEISNLRLLKLSTSVKELENLQQIFPIKKIEEDLNELRESVYPEIPPSRDLHDRKAFLTELCKWRKKYFEDYPWVREEIIELVDYDEFEDTETNIDSRQEDLEHFIFSLHSDVVDKFR